MSSLDSDHQEKSKTPQLAYFYDILAKMFMVKDKAQFLKSQFKKMD